MKLIALGCFAAVVLSSGAHARDDGQYANSPSQQWYQGLQIPDAARNRMGVAFRSCCDKGDVFRTQFRVASDGSDQWLYLDNDGRWKVIPADIILSQPSIDSEPRLFKRLATGEPLCFIKPNGGI
jgi:hypothetical protein